MLRGGAVRVGSVRGIPIRIHVSFLIVLPFLALGFGRVYEDAARLAEVPASELHGTPFLWGLVVALALFGSVLVHELAHSLYALAKGGRVRAITLTLIGGVSELSEPPRRGRDEAMMALVGPLTSLLLGGGFYLLLRALAGTGSFDVRFAAFHLFSLNVVLGLFNLLPAFPMDGGRVLRGLLAEKWGAVRATRVAATAGKGFAVLFAIAGFLSANILLMVVAFFVYLGAEAESRGVLLKALLGQLRVRDLMSARLEAVDPSTSVYELGERMLRSRRLAFPVVEGGSVVGAVSLEDVRKVPAGERGHRHVADIVRRIPPVEASDDASRALRALAEARAPLVPVVEGGAFVGVLTQQDLSRALQLRDLEETQHPRSARRERAFFRRAEERG
jgi:Zn-dependent protease/predicted transcriptional regulator